MNYLPIKLQKLRKHYNYSQSYLAEVLGVDVVEYMGYENARKMINYSQMRKLASLYHINVAEIFNNTDEVTLYEVSNTDTDKINIEYFIPKKTIFSRAKKHPFITGGIFGALVAIIVFSSMYISKNNRPYISYADNTDRLSVSDASLVYIDNVGAVKGAGDNSNGQISNLPSEHAAKVVEGSNFTAILLEDGTVTCSGLMENYLKDISKWNNISDIAAGYNHIVAVDNLGKVYCVGDNSKGQCDVSNFSNIKNIYATPFGTIGINHDGECFYTGSITGTSVLKKYTNILDIDANENNLIVLKEDGTCDYATSLDNSIYFKVSQWKDIIKVTCGNDFFAGLKSDGTVVVASLNLDESKVATWRDIIAIDSGVDYLIGFDGKEIKGVGKNTYHQFDTGESAIQSLSQVKNIVVDYTNDVVKVTYEQVNNASEYEVTLYIDEITTLVKRVKPNEWASFDTKMLEDNHDYKVSVVAIGDGSINQNSLISEQHFTFLEEVEEISEEKITIRNDVVGSYRGDFEDYLKSLGIKEIGSSESDKKCDGSVERVEEISGITPGSTYSLTELNARNITYTYCKLVLENQDDSANLEN